MKCYQEVYMSIRKEHQRICNEFMKGTEKFYFSPITVLKYLLLDFPSALDDLLSEVPSFLYASSY